MEFVLVGVLVVLQKDLDLAGHPRPNILAPQARQYTDAAKRYRCQSGRAGQKRVRNGCRPERHAVGSDVRSGPLKSLGMVLLTVGRPRMIPGMHQALRREPLL